MKHNNVCKIRILLIGNSKETYIKDWSDELQKRISKFSSIELLELNSKQTDIKKRQKEEFELLSSKFETGRFKVLLDVEGRSYNSIEFSKKIIDSGLTNFQGIDFFIGGPFGLRQEDKQIFDTLVSLSNLTFNHQLAKVVLLEQIYRSFTIIKGITYHY
ncbi:23S rRNA (pseudouridine(1915)-N(3))-methyltransferase RlmH [Candidatus Dojkabacteria bacterium]|uniref:Ribosomal RNA large subunit methyltransferase H n=1 Tax=Candidatus Dojkabacteria bacterium TaxID=2099670 RepID=A0A955L445_9BACT|nr:23S rRNA (pseudouridine(1915)-N(3))-methyltransferase RlmH [Candidatus Dojkabacteria bacterium]